MTQIDPRQLRIFLEVCRQGSISGAARELNMAQPSVSVAIAQLERSVGTRLFQRSRTGITLERPGIALRRRAEAMDTLLYSARAELALMEQDVVGPLVIGGTPGALASLVPAAIVQLKHSYPRADIRILERPDANLVELLRTERIDLAIVTTGIEAVPEDIIEEAVLQDPFDLIVGRQNDHLSEMVSLSSVADLPWVLPDAVGAFRRQIDALFVFLQTQTPRDVIRCDSLLTTKAIVRNSTYVTILPREVAAAELNIGVLRAVEIENVGFRRNVGVLRLAGKKPGPFTEAFMAAVRDTNLP
jgi:LysR family transcriptional regulator, regulator of abg operon